MLLEFDEADGYTLRRSRTSWFSDGSYFLLSTEMMAGSESERFKKMVIIEGGKW